MASQQPSGGQLRRWKPSRVLNVVVHDGHWWLGNGWRWVVLGVLCGSGVKVW